MTLWWNLLSDYGITGAVIAILAVAAVVFLAMSLVDLVHWLALRIRHPRHRPSADPRILDAFVRGDDIPALRAAALERGRALFGADARLAVEDIISITTASTSGAAFRACVRIRRLDALDVPGHEADPHGRLRRPLVQALIATRAWSLLPGRLQGALCNCPVDRGEA